MLRLVLTLLVLMLLNPWTYGIPITTIILYNITRLALDTEEDAEEDTRETEGK